MLVTGDLHLSDKPAEQYRHDFVGEHLPALLKRRDEDVLVILGDLTEQKDRHPARLVNQVVAHIAKLASIVPVVVLCGNHDYRTTGQPFFEFLKQLPNVAWVGDVCAGEHLPNKRLAKAMAGCLFLPHTFNYEEDWQQSLRTLDKHRYVFAHNTFTGANVGFGRNLEGIPIEVLPKKAKVVSGDIHVPQELGPVTYVGAPYTVDFGDDYEPRLLSDRASKGDMHSIVVATYPQKRLVEFESANKIKGRKGCNEGDIVKVRVPVKSMANWSGVQQAIAQWADKYQVVVVRSEPIVERVRPKSKARIDAKQSDYQVFDSFCKLQKVPKDTAKVGLEFVKSEG